MGKDRTPDLSSWGGRMKEWGGGDFCFLSSDGEAITFIVVGLPEQMESVYKGKKQTRIGCPVSLTPAISCSFVARGLPESYPSLRDSLTSRRSW